MKNKRSFLGILGLIALTFAAITSFVLPVSGSTFALVQAVIGLILVFAFLLGGGFAVLKSHALSRTAGLGLGSLLYTSLFLSLVVMVNYYFVVSDPLYFDSTEKKIFTLAPQTQTVIGKLDRNVDVRGFFVGAKIGPELERTMAGLLRISNAINWQVIDPVTSPQLVQKYSITEPNTLHFSFADGSETREVRISRELSEQDIVNAILKLTRGEQRKLYWVSGHGESNLDDENQAGYLQLKRAIQGENVQVEKLELAKARSVPADASLLLLSAPRKELLEFERIAVAKYLEAGGNAIFLSEPRTSRDIATLVEPYGVLVGDDIILDEVVKLLEGPTLVVQPMITEYGIHPITRDFAEGIILSTSNSVTAAKQNSQEVQVTEYAFTSEKSWAEKNLELLFSEPPLAELEPDDTKGPVSVAVAVQGKGRIAVLGDADFLANVNISHLYNRDFFLNTMNWTLGDDERVSIRASTMRGSTKTIKDDQLKRMFLVTAILIPELLLLWGLFVWWSRQ